MSTVQECDSLLANVSERKSTLQSRITIMQIRQNDSVGATNSYLQELTEALQEIANLEAQIATMPEGDEKADKELALSIAIVNRNRAQKNLRSKGPGSKLVKDLDIASVQHEIDECDLLIAATNTRKAEIQGS